MKKNVFLAGVLIALMAAAVFAQTEADFDVSVTNNQVTIDYYKGTATTVNIPARIRNMPVVAIEANAFQRKNISSVTIPAGVTTIGGAAFQGCANLASVTIPASVRTIESGAFGDTGLTSLTIPQGVTTIGQQAFSGCAKLTSVTIPASVTSIGANAFGSCTSLTSVTFSGTMALSGFNANAFGNPANALGIGDIRDKFYAGNASVGVAGRYMRPNGESKIWTKQ
jgi:hypothetical protein